MAIRDIVVCTDNSRSLKATIGVAADVAIRHRAHLTGFQVIPTLAVPAYALYPVGPDVLEAQRQAAEDRAQQARTVFEDATASMKATCGWRQVEGDPAREICAQSHYADLVVMSQPDAHDPDSLSQQVVEDVLLGSSAPVLIIPYIGHSSDPPRQVMIAWDGSRESARAAHDALAFISEANQVSVVTVSKNGGDRGTTAAGTELAEHLARHGFAVSCREVPAGNLSTGDSLLSLCADESTDLLVMGAYGHTRLREVVLGGATDHLLRHMTVPVLMAH